MISQVSSSRLKGFRFPRSIISYAVRGYHRFALSLRDVEDLLVERGVNGPTIACQGRPHCASLHLPQYPLHAPLDASALVSVPTSDPRLRITIVPGPADLGK